MNRPLLDKPDVPELGLYDLFFDKYGFIRKVVKERVCESCGAVWIDDGTYSDHCDPMDMEERG